MSSTRQAFLISILGLLLATAPAAAQQLLNNASNPDTTPTYDSSGQVVEPDVLYVPGGWNGYHYWMAVTPYTCSDETHENPSILASNDGRTWSAPATNPLVPGGANCDFTFVNNDPSIVMVDNILYMYYMVEYRHCMFCADSINVFRISTTDGVNWSSPQTLIWGNGAFHQEPNYKLSQSVVYKDGTWYMWYIDYPSCGSSAIVHRMSSSDGVNWPTANNVSCSISSQQGYPFHLTVKNFAGSYEMLYTTCTDSNIYYATSGDGTSWSSLTTPVLKPGSTWDNRVIYRSSLMGKYPNIAAFYGGSSTSTCNGCEGNNYVWHEGFASTGDYIPPITITDFDFKKIGTSSVTLRWTAPGDDEATGTATSYSICYSNSPITEANWYLATAVSGAPTPHTAGVTDTIKINISQNVWYYFAIKATDDVGNESWLSDVPCIKLGHPSMICDGGFALTPIDRTPPDESGAVALAIQSVRPIPARDEADVSYTLPRMERSSLELLDVAGRLIMRTEVASGAGAHVAHLDLRRLEHHGVAFLRLRQGDASVTTPIVVLQ